MAAHKHAALIRQWADGAEIQYRKSPFDKWNDALHPAWMEDYEYRVKPPEPERVYPETKMTGDQLFEYFMSAPGVSSSDACIIVADRALRHACDAGQIVTREEFDRAITDRKARDKVVVEAVIGRFCSPILTADVQAFMDSIDRGEV